MKAQRIFTVVALHLVGCAAVEPNDAFMGGTEAPTLSTASPHRSWC